MHGVEDSHKCVYLALRASNNYLTAYVLAINDTILAVNQVVQLFDWLSLFLGVTSQLNVDIFNIPLEFGIAPLTLVIMSVQLQH